MKPNQAVAAAREMLQGPRAFEAPRLDMLDAAMKPWTPQTALAALEIRGVTSSQMEGALSALVGLARKSQTNFLPLILDVFGQGMKVDNYLTGVTTDPVTQRKSGDQAGPWKWWQRNKMGAAQTGIHRSALQYGVSYATVLPSLRAKSEEAEEAERPVYIRGASPRQMTALYGEPMAWDPRYGGPVDDDWPILALEMRDSMIRVYDEQSVHFIGVQHVPKSALGWTDPTFGSANNFAYIEGRSHDVGVCPVVRYRDRVLLNGEEVFGIIEPLLAIQSRIDETTYQMMVAQYWSAFRQRYVMGWIPKTEADALRHAASDTWYFKDAAVKVGQFEATDLKNYSESGDSARRDLSAIGQVPAQQLGLTGISNISEASLAALEAGKDRKGDEIQTSLGESHEQTMRTAAHISGDVQAAADFGSEVIWRDKTARSLAQTVDALGKMGTMLNIPDEILWGDIPGWTKEKVDRALEARDRQADRTIEV